MVSDAWRDGREDPIHTRVQNVAGRLTSWAENTFRAVQKRIKMVERKLKETQGRALDAQQLLQCNEIVDELDDLRRLEESYWHARARANELRDGDKNTKYFHHKASQRKKRNAIAGLFDGNEVWQSTKGEMDAIIAEYFGGCLRRAARTGSMRLWWGSKGWLLMI